MLKLNQPFKLLPTKAIAKDVDGVVVRRCRFKLERDLDEEMAESIGSVGPKALELVADHSSAKVVMPIDACHGEMTLVGDGQSVTIERADGLKAVASAPKIAKNEDDEEGAPTVKLEFECGMTDEVWLFLGRKAHAWVTVTFNDAQLELPLAGAPKAEPAPAEAKPSKKRGRKASTKSSHGHDRAEAAGEIPDPQDAATPEEAEELRAQRLREQQQEHEGVWAEESGNGHGFKAAGADDDDEELRF